MPTKDNYYNTSHNFHIKCMFPNKMEMNIVSQSKVGNGILFEGTKGNLFVSCGKLTGPAVDELKEKPLAAQTILDVYTHHNAMTTCHLANISIRLGRKLKWDPKREQIICDDEANQWQDREQRKGFESNF